jgi:predicted DCC family thiol-disulfide oxidoreductase YuxK
VSEAPAHPVILFDGVCNLCERSVRFVVRRDREARFRFAPLQSVAARQLLADHNHTDERLSSVLLIESGQLYTKSRAALRIARRLDGPWPLVVYLFGWVPQVIADTVYDFVGRRRYRWFGEKDACWMPEDELKGRFLRDAERTD